MNILGIIATVIVIGFIILIHEFGHYIVGKLSGAAVSKFSIGWGPKIISFKRKETRYQISWIPLIGGYVRLPGMEGESAELTDEEAADIKKYNLKTFEEMRTWQKFLAFLGGVGMQLIVCLVILTLLVGFMGKPTQSVFIASVNETSPAQAAGIKQGDVILKVEDKKISSVEELQEHIGERGGRKTTLSLRRQEGLEEIDVVPEYNDDYGRAVIGVGIGQGLNFIDLSKDNMRWYDYISGGAVLMWQFLVMILKILWLLITGQLSLKMAGGPLAIAIETKNALDTGFLYSVYFFVLINLNLAVINAMPFPALDGGHVLFLGIEKIFRLKIKPKAKEIINYIGFALIIILMLTVTYNDIMRYFFKDRQSSRQTKETISYQPHETGSAVSERDNINIELNKK